MEPGKTKRLRLSDRDLDFLIETVSSDVSDKLRLKQIIREDEDFRNQFVGEEQVFRKVMDDDEILLKISPTLFFEILLRKAVNELEGRSYTYEKTSTMRIPVFDSKDVVDLLEKESLLIRWHMGPYDEAWKIYNERVTKVFPQIHAFHHADQEASKYLDSIS